jgi:excisionase family DNA binding protein
MEDVIGGYMDTEVQFVTVDEAAERIGVHSQTIRRWLRGGQMLGTLITRQTGYRIPKDEVERVLTDGLREPALGKELAAA